MTRDADPLGDTAIAGGAAGNPLAEAQRWLRAAAQNLPLEAMDATSAYAKSADALALVPGGQMVTPGAGGSIGTPAVTAHLRTSRNWRVDVPLAMAVHGLGVIVALAGGRVGEAASYASTMVRLCGKLSAPVGAATPATLSPAAFVAVVRVGRAARSGVPESVSAGVSALLALPACAGAAAAVDTIAWLGTPACEAFSLASLTHASAVAELSLEAVGYPLGLAGLPFHAAAPGLLELPSDAAALGTAAAALRRGYLSGTPRVVPASHAERQAAFALVCRAAEVGLLSDADVGEAATSLLGLPVDSVSVY